MSKAGFKRMMRERALPLRPATPTALQPRQPRQRAEAVNDANDFTMADYRLPNDEQLANFVACMVNAKAEELGVSAATLTLDTRMTQLMLEANPLAKAGWLRKHREFQEAALRG
jgi:hypothetical protein